MAKKKEDKKLVKYVAKVDLDTYFADMSLLGMTAANVEKLAKGESLEEKDLGKQFAYMLKNNIIGEES